MLKQCLRQAMEQYLVARTENLHETAAIADSQFAAGVRQAEAALDKLLRLARELEREQPQLIRLVVDYESAAAGQYWLGVRIAYREGLRDSGRVRRNFAAFLGD